jgi:LCP family protein required for cell wall assembly
VNPSKGLLAAVTAVAVVGAGIGFAVGLSGAPAPSQSAQDNPSASMPASAEASGTMAPSGAPSGSVAPSPSIAPSPSPSSAPGGPDPLLGKDGRFTALVLGSDARPSHPGNRTDAIMVVSVDPVSGAAAAVSIPRDLLNFPLPNGKTWRSKVNALYQHYLATTKNGNAAMKRAVSSAFDIEIDGLVLVGFDGVKRLVRAVGGVTVTLEEPYYDAYYWVNNRTQGWGLSAGTHKLNAENALIFARSRKGDSDYGRAARQQQLVIAAVEKVKQQGPDKLPSLVKIIGQSVRTDLPREQAVRIYEIVSRAKLSEARQAVLGPRAFGVILGPSRYELDIKKVRRWIENNFPPVTENGTWPPPASPSPSGTTVP